MRLKYRSHGQSKDDHPFYVKADWNHPVQPSVALESYLVEDKLQLAEIKITTAKQNLSSKERKTLKELKQNADIIITVVMNKLDKMRWGQIEVNVQQNYRPLVGPIVML